MTIQFQVSIEALHRCGIGVFESDNGVLDPGETLTVKGLDGRWHDATVDSILDDGQIMLRPVGTSEDQPAVSFDQWAESVESSIRLQIRPINPGTFDKEILAAEAPSFGSTDAFLVCSDQETKEVTALFKLEGDQAENILVGEKEAQPCGVAFALEGAKNFKALEPRNPLKRAAFWKEATDLETKRVDLVFLYSHLRRTENEIGFIMSLPSEARKDQQQIHDMWMAMVYNYAIAIYNYDQLEADYLASSGEFLAVSRLK